MINETIIPTAITIANTSAIPLVITTKTSWVQWIPYILISSVVTLWFILKMVGVGIKSVSTKIFLLLYKLKVKRNVLMIRHNEDSFFIPSMITVRDYEKIGTILSSKFKGKPFDLILHTPGGDMFASMIISKLFKNYKGEIRAIVPGYAMSGGTMLALSSDKIYMNDCSSLGPVDPQIGMLWKYGSERGWKELMKFKGKKVGDDSFMYSYLGKQAKQEMKIFLKGLLSNHTTNEKIINHFVEGKTLHSHQFSRDDLVSMGMDIKKISRKMSKLLFKLIGLVSEESIHYA